MKFRILLVLFIAVSVFVNSQELSLDTDKCMYFKMLGDKAFSNNDFSKAVDFYFKSEKNCNSLEKIYFDKLITSIKNTITNSKDIALKAKYIDSLELAYVKAESNGFYDQTNDLIRAAFILKSTKPDYKKVDELFVRAMTNKSITLSETQITLYFSNLYTLFLDIHRDDKPALKRRIIKEYFELSQVLISEKMSDKTKTNLDMYFNMVIKDCQTILPDIEIYLNTLSKIEKEKQAELTNLKIILELNKCESSLFYEDIIDSLIAIEPSVDLYLASANCLSNRQEYSKAFSTLFFAKKMAKDEAKKQEIDFLSAKALFNAGNYSEAYKIAIIVKGDYLGEACILAAQCVAKSTDSCGSNNIEQKLNLFYAYKLLLKAKEAGIEAPSLMTEYFAKLPNDAELASIYLKKGQEVNLSCWGVKVLIPH